MTGLLLAAGLVLLVAGAELLVRGATRLATVARISPLVIGLTVVAYGTSAPEMAVSLQSTLGGQADIAFGNVVGSNIFNVLFILGLSATIAPLAVSGRLIRFDVPLMIAVSLLLWLLSANGVLGAAEAGVLLAGSIAYTVVLLWQGRREGEPAAMAGSSAADAAPAGGRRLAGAFALVLLGLALLVLGSRWLVGGATAIAQMLGISELVIGLTIVAAGTSLPELATSVLASIRGQRDIAVGNVVGSNIFNILAILGISGVVGGGLDISASALAFDIPIMTAVAVACLPVFFTGSAIARWEGAIFLGYYAAYATFLGLHASGHHILDEFATAMLLFAVPLTLITLGTTLVRERRR